MSIYKDITLFLFSWIWRLLRIAKTGIKLYLQCVVSIKNWTRVSLSIIFRLRKSNKFGSRSQGILFYRSLEWKSYSSIPLEMPTCWPCARQKTNWRVTGENRPSPTKWNTIASLMSPKNGIGRWISWTLKAEFFFALL